MAEDQINPTPTDDPQEEEGENDDDDEYELEGETGNHSDDDDGEEEEGEGEENGSGLTALLLGEGIGPVTAEEGEEEEDDEYADNALDAANAPVSIDHSNSENAKKRSFDEVNDESPSDLSARNGDTAKKVKV